MVSSNEADKAIVEGYKWLKEQDSSAVFYERTSERPLDKELVGIDLEPHTDFLDGCIFR